MLHANPPSNSPSPLAHFEWRYGSIAIALHWAIAILIAATAGLGWYMLENEEAPGITWFFDLHRSIGVVIALLLLIRVAWRVAHRPATLPSSVPRWQARLASGAQVLLYLLMTAMVVVAHVLGALKHLVMDKDGVFQRMWFTRR